MQWNGILRDSIIWKQTVLAAVSCVTLGSWSRRRLCISETEKDCISEAKKKKKRLHISEAEKGCAFQKQKKTAFQKQKMTAFQNAQLPEVYCDRQMLALLSWGIWGWGLLYRYTVYSKRHMKSTHMRTFIHMHTCTCIPAHMRAHSHTHTPPTPTPPPPPRYRLLVVTKSNLINSCAIMVLLYFTDYISQPTI